MFKVLLFFNFRMSTLTVFQNAKSTRDLRTVSYFNFLEKAQLTQLYGNNFHLTPEPKQTDDLLVKD